MPDSRLNGDVVGESGINALVAAHYGVPIIFVSGDKTTAREFEGFAQQAEKVVVKHSLGRFAAGHIHQSVAWALLQAGATRAVRKLGQKQPPAFGLPIGLEVTFLVADMSQ